MQPEHDFEFEEEDETHDMEDEDAFISNPAKFLVNILARKDLELFNQKVMIILGPNYPVDQWFQCLVEMDYCNHGADRASWLEPLFHTDHLERKKRLLAHAIRNSGGKCIDREAARRISLKLIHDCPEFVYVSDNGGEEVETIMHVAARCGDVRILKTLISHAKKREGMLASCLRRSNQGRTPLGTAISEGHIELVKIFIEQMETLDDLGDRDELLSSAVDKKQSEMFKTIISKFPDLLDRSTNFVRSIIREGRLSEWEMVVEVGIDPALREMPDLLHDAIEYRQVSMVRTIIEHQPQLAAQEIEPFGWPLSKNAPSEDDDEETLAARKEIRKIILPAIIREMDPSSVRKIFEDAGNNLDQISLNLGIFARESHDFFCFLHLINHELIKKEPLCFNVEFEPVLKMVKFPDFERILRWEDRTKMLTRPMRRIEAFKNLKLQEEPPQMNPLPESGRSCEVSRIMQWLHDVKRVRKIYQLTVPDYFENPHTEEVIEAAIEPFEIEILDWRRLDLAVDSIKKGAPNVRRLHLYSSGNQAALSHWFGSEGIRLLDQLKHVEMKIYNHNISASRANLLKAKTNQKLLEWKSKMIKPDEYTFQVSVSDPPSKSSTWQDTNDNTLEIPDLLKGLDPFLSTYTTLQRERSLSGPFRRVRVAVIDNGIDDFSLGQKVSNGISFVYHGDEESNWWLASDSHGTQMAKIVNHVDPYCELYIAKVGDNTKNLMADRVVEVWKSYISLYRENRYTDSEKAIDWAVKQKVDIISMSFVLHKPAGLSLLQQRALENAVERAEKERILMFCSTADMETNRENVFPAACFETFKIASRDRAVGAATESWSSDGTAHYHFQAKDISTDGIHYMTESKDTISGASVATALAAGVASLVLACDRFANDEESSSPKKTITNAFNQMRSDSTSKFVQPTNYFPNKQLGNGAGENWIRAKFRQV